MLEKLNKILEEMEKENIRLELLYFYRSFKWDNALSDEECLKLSEFCLKILDECPYESDFVFNVVCSYMRKNGLEATLKHYFDEDELLRAKEEGEL